MKKFLLNLLFMVGVSCMDTEPPMKRRDAFGQSEMQMKMDDALFAPEPPMKRCDAFWQSGMQMKMDDALFASEPPMKRCDLLFGQHEMQMKMDDALFASEPPMKRRDVFGQHEMRRSKLIVLSEGEWNAVVQEGCEQFIQDSYKYISTYTGGQDVLV